jgi:hypothetical protein
MTNDAKLTTSRMKATAALPDERVTIHWKLRAGKNFVEASGISYIIAEKDLYQEPQNCGGTGIRTPDPLHAIAS